MTILRFMINAWTKTLANTSKAWRRLNTRQYYFSPFLKIRKRTPQPLIQVIVYIRYLFVELSLRFSGPSPTTSRHILSWRNSISNSLWLLPRWSILTLNILLLRLWRTVVVEVIEHQIEIRVDILSQMILYLIFFINRDSKCRVSWTLYLRRAWCNVWVSIVILI